MMEPPPIASTRPGKKRPRPGIGCAPSWKKRFPGLRTNGTGLIPKSGLRKCRGQSSDHLRHPIEVESFHGIRFPVIIQVAIERRIRYHYRLVAENPVVAMVRKIHAN